MKDALALAALLKLQPLAVLLALWAVGCGDLASGASPSLRDAGKDVGLYDSRSTDGDSTEEGSPSDGETFACGDASCGETEKCVYAGCGFPIEPLTDAGSCPDGTAFDEGIGCAGPVHCPVPPSCSSDCVDSVDSGFTAQLIRALEATGSSHICVPRPPP